MNRSSTTPPPFLPTSALSLDLEAFVAIRAALLSGMADARATFECALPARPRDASHAFLVFAGLDPLLDALERFRLRGDDLTWLESVGALDGATARLLGAMRFACDIDAALEGTVVFPGEPVLTVEGPYWQAQLIAGLVTRALAHATHVATSCARATLAAGGAEIIESGASTRIGFAGSPLLARAAFVGGAASTTCALAGRRYRIPVRAIQPARWAAIRGDEAEAVAAWLEAAGDHAIVRVDDADPERSLTHVTAVLARILEGDRWDPPTLALCLTGDDVVGVAERAFTHFRAARLPEPMLVVEGDLDERQIAELRREEPRLGAFVFDGYGQPAAVPVATYDLVAVEERGRWTPRGKNPGRKVLLRYVDADGRPVADVAHATRERLQAASAHGAVTSAPLLTSVMRGGKRAIAAEPVTVTRERAFAAVRALPERYRRLARPARFPYSMTDALRARR